MAKKQFKAESKKLLDMMVNSIYTHKEIFLREIISNASDAIDKLHFRSLTDTSIAKEQGPYEIRIIPDKKGRTLTVEDNGCGMTAAELESNLGVIAKSGSLEFKKQLEEKSGDIDVIGQFGVGFYSAFMVADNIKVLSRAYGSEEANLWESEGASGYTVTPATREKAGTTVILHLKEDTEDDRYSDFLEEYQIRNLIRKYSDYIRYPIKMLCSTSRLKEGSEDEYESVLEDKVLNSIVPLWKRPEKDVTEEEYNKFYSEKYYDFEKPLLTIRQKAEGRVEYQSLLFIPSRAPYDYYTKEYEKGLQLYSSGVMIMDKCADLLPDHFSFVKGIVDSPDLSLNISREMLQHDKQLKLIAKNLESKIASKLSDMLTKDRANYEKFYEAFGPQLKFGVYNDYGTHKELLQDLLLFRSSFEDKQTTLKEYVLRMKDGQDQIFYAPGMSDSQIRMLPQVEAAIDKGYEVLYLTHEVDEFALHMLGEYQEKTFCNICSEAPDLLTDEEKEALKKENESAADILTAVKEALADAVADVRFTTSLKGHPACISNEGVISASMERTLNQMPGAEERVKAQLVLEINLNSPVCEKLKALHAEGGEAFADFCRLLYHNARLISGLDIEDPAQFSSLIAKLMAK
ncbi:MAG: molecular chaperone HtpG [Firmicutes bacterium]|nr:molecular chaperone HtpG [Bacillota bacterium]